MQLPDDPQFRMDRGLAPKYWSGIPPERQQELWARLVRLRREQGHDWPDEILDWAAVRAEVRRRDKAYADSLKTRGERFAEWVVIELVFSRRRA